MPDQAENVVTFTESDLDALSARARETEELVEGVERAEELIEIRDQASEDLKEHMMDLKNAGFDTKIVRHILKLRAMEPGDLALQDTLIETYRAKVGV